MTDEAQHFLEKIRDNTNSSLPALLQPHSDNETEALSGLWEAAHYSVNIGGKRVRPALVVAAAQSIAHDVDLSVLESPAAAIELVHTYSLVHDDLPAMDDDNLRRGSPSLHKAYNESTAILVGDGLQARAFELLAKAPKLSAQQRLDMVKVVASAAGPLGMVGGQYLDINAVGTHMGKDDLSRMHLLKTGALIRAAVALGGIVANGTEGQMQLLDQYGKSIGLAFQVVDDILDVEGSSQALGKTSGKDSNSNKPTYVSLCGLEGAKKEAAHLLAEALEALSSFGKGADRLRELATYVVERDR
jgi:geranylgeranyl pyrophosphate synthase